MCMHICDSVESTSAISHLLSDTHVDECLQTVTEVTDKEDDIICDDWKSLWCARNGCASQHQQLSAN